MEKYLRMSDVFNGEVLVSNSTAYTLKSELDRLYRVHEVNDDTLMCSGSDVAEYAAHAINSHDELVEMNKDLLEVIERVIGSSNEFDKIMGTSEWADGYKQCSIDTGETLLGMLDNIKAKGTA